MRIRRHDALGDNVCHALSQSHPDVLKKQHVSCESHSCPGDVYHPDFSVAILPTLICQFAALPSLLIFLLLLLVLGLPMQLGS